MEAFSGRLALKDTKRQLSYHSLDEVTNGIAWEVLGTVANGPVAIFVEHGTAVAIAMLGAIKAGRPYVPVEPAYPERRIREMLADFEPRAILTDSVNLERARALGLQCIDVENLAGRRDAPSVQVAPDALCYILYTSGSTGRPKGVMQTHSNVLHNVMKYSNGARITNEDRLLLLASASFSQSVSDIYGALLNGAALLPFSLREEGIARLSDWIDEQEVTIYHSVPTVFRHLLRQSGSRIFRSVRLVKLGGEAVYRSDAELFREHFGRDSVFHVGYGATEMNIIRQYFLTPGDELPTSVMPVGYEVEDTQIVLVTECGEEVRAGEVGEIIIRSRYLSPGYWRRPELTQATFSAVPGEGGVTSYRTGDLGRLRPDGCLEHRGRRDAQVKVRGHRIELGEIEAVLDGLGLVGSAAVVPRESKTRDIHLVCFFVPLPKTPAPSAVRQILSERLPDFMVPSAFIPVESMPLTATGKIDRHTLSDVAEAEREKGRASGSPRNAVESALARIWAHVLEVERVAIDDDFFEIGGHSLLATEVVAHVRKEFGIDLPLRALFESPTVVGLSELIVQKLAEALSEDELTQLLAEAEATVGRS
ncbi:MAG: non-ribosomal peptide synthetase [Burkholderiales bacterium]